MNRILSTGTKKLYQTVFERLGNGYASTAGMKGPVAQGITLPPHRCGLHSISRFDMFLRDFSIANPDIASVSERWYGRDIKSRATLGNASPRHRCVVDMSRSDNGGLLRAVFDKFGQLKRILSIAKNGSSVATDYRLVTRENGVVLLTRKVARDVDGTILKEVYTEMPQTGRKSIHMYILDAKNGYKEILNSRDGNMAIFGEGVGYEHISKPDFTLSCVKPSTVKVEKCNLAGIEESIRQSKQSLSELGWKKFLPNKN